MSNEQKIIDKIAADAKAEADKMIQAARIEAEKIIQSAEEKAKKELTRFHDLAQAEAEKAASKEISGAHMNAKKKILLEKQQILENVIKESEEKLLNLNDEEYEKVIEGMLELAEDGQDCEVVISQKDKDKIGKLIAAKGRKLSEETRPISGGFIIKKGDIEYNYSFESIVTVEREDMEKIAADILFG